MSRHFRPSKTLEELASHFLSPLICRVLRHPEDPKLCIFALCHALTVLDFEKKNDLDVRTNFHALLDTVMAFLNYPMNQEAFVAFQIRWSRPCGCLKDNFLIRHLHQRIPEVDSNFSFVYVIDHLIAIACKATASIPPGKLDAGAAKNKWPTSFSALLPNGPTNFIASTARWVKLTMSENPTQTSATFMMANVMTFCPSILDPLVSSTELRKDIASQFHNIVEAIRSRRPESPTSPPYAHSLHHINMFIGTTTYAANETQYMYWRPTALQIYLDIVALLPLMQHAVEFPSEEDKNHLIQCFLAHGLTMHSLIPRSTPSIPPLLNSMANKLHELCNPTVLLYRYLHARKQSDVCAGPDCYRSAEEIKSSMQKCSGCILLRYCSKKCQKAHWTWPIVKHKTECAKLATALVVFRRLTKNEVITEGSISIAPERYEAFDRELKAAGLTSSDVDMLLESYHVLQCAMDRKHLS